jgi:hypothetical protein
MARRGVEVRAAQEVAMRRFAFVSLLALAAPPCFAEGMVCLQLSSIEHTEVVDDRTILFHMRDGSHYRNVLPARCPGLKFEDGFSYATSIDQLCSNVEIIRVLRRGTSCGLGAFEKLGPGPNR